MCSRPRTATVSSALAIRAAISTKRMRPARKAATATSLAALGATGAHPPATQGRCAPAGGGGAGKRVGAGRLEGEGGDLGEIEPLRRGGQPPGIRERVEDRNAHV